MITIIDYGLGNLASVANALARLGIPYTISSKVADLRAASALILPGVGAAGFGMQNLIERGLAAEIKTQLAKGKPVLGICLGMQLLFSTSEEGNVRCLDLIPGQVKKFETTLKVPQIGWNQVSTVNSRLLTGITNQSFFYFVHSYYCQPADTTTIAGTTEYDQTFCSVVEANNIYGVQFHPEKSGEAGLQLLRNFGKLV